MKTFITFLILGLIAWGLGLGLFGPLGFRNKGRDGLFDAALGDYAKSETAKWITLPPQADKITTFLFFGRDTNYRYLKAMVDADELSLPDLMRMSLQSQPRLTNDTFVSFMDANITFEGFASAFSGISSSMPSWWETDFSRFDQQIFCVWQDDNNYGYGYVFLYDSEQGELRVFQWGQQWNTVARTKEALVQ